MHLAKSTLSEGSNNPKMILDAGPPAACQYNTITSNIWPRGVTVSTLDSESSDRGSNPREAFA